MPYDTLYSPSHYPFIDIHSHQRKAGDHIQLLSLDTHELAAPPSVSLRQDRSATEKRQDEGYFCIGLHPWFIEQQDSVQAMSMLETYLNDPGLLAIGECGLDKTVATDLARQIVLFEQHIALSEKWRKPIIIHCVRAYNELLRIKKRCKPKQAWIIHGFNNKPPVAEQLLKHGCYLSLGKALLHPFSNAAKTLETMPLDRLFLETDDADDISISAIYAAAATIAGSSVDDLKQRIFDNFTHVFSNE